jgi:peptidoglycan hydrolase-like protein with peptidoglycan-binding domain
MKLAIVHRYCSLPTRRGARGTRVLEDPSGSAISDNGKSVSLGEPYEALLKQVQEKLRANGFDAGPANGTYSTKMQAALAQFQLASSLPVSGSLDDATLFALGVDLGLTNAPQEAERDAAGAAEKAPG